MPPPGTNGDDAGSLLVSDRRRLVRASLASGVGYLMAIVGRFVGFPNKHGATLALGAVLIGAGFLLAFTAMGYCYVLILRGRKALRAMPSGLDPAYAPDPTKKVGELSSDGERFWNGTAWVSASSADGKLRWDGTRWTPEGEQRRP